MQIGNDTEFTRGPLVVHSEGPDDNSQPNTDGWPFHVCRPSTQLGTSDYHTAIGIQSLADARLYAAAPELLAALVGLDAAFCTNEDTAETRRAARQALIAAREAIAKAKG